MSNWSFSDFVKDGIKYTSMEQYRIHRKALTFGDMEIAERIMSAFDTSENQHRYSCFANFS